MTSDKLLEVKRNVLTILPRRSQIVPDRFFTRLIYAGQKNVSIPIASSAVAYRYTPTSAFDIDPLLGSTAMPGYAEFAAFYNNYRVTVSKIEVEGSANYANTLAPTSLSLILLPLNVDPGGTPSVATIQSWTGNPYAKYKQMAQPGGPITSFVDTMSTEKIYGSEMIYYDDNFSSLTTGVPNNNWFWAIGVISDINAAGTAYTAGITVRIHVGVEFYDRKVLSN